MTNKYKYQPKKIVNGIPIGYSKNGLEKLEEDKKKGYWEMCDEYDEDSDGNLIVVGKTKRFVSSVHLRDFNFRIIGKKEWKKLRTNKDLIRASEYGSNVVVIQNEIGCVGIYRLIVKD